MKLFFKVKIAALAVVLVGTVCAVSCGGSGSAVLNKDKPLVFLTASPPTRRPAKSI